MQVSHNKGLENTTEKAINIHQLWTRYIVQYKYLFLALFAVTMAGAWAYLKIAMPVYDITARLLIKDEKKGVADAMNDDRGSIAILNTSKISENEMEIIQSRSIMADVVKSLHLYAPVYTKKKFTAPSAYTSSPVTIEALKPDSLKPAEHVYFTYDEKYKKVIIAGSAYELDKFLPTPYGLLKFTVNQKATEVADNANFYFNLVSVKNTVSAIQRGLTVGTASKMSSILNLSLKDEVPEKGVDILNGVLAAYNKASLNDKNILAANTLAFVEDRLEHITHDLDSIEHQMQNYKAQKGAVDVSEQGRLFLQNVSINDQKISDMNMQLAGLNEVEQYVQSKQMKGGIVPSSLGINDQMLNGLLEHLSQAQLQYEKIRKTTPDNNPMVVAITDQITKLRPEILENIQNRRQGIEAGRRNIMAANASYSSVLSRLPQKERELVDISREQNIRSEIYLMLLKKREESALTFSSSVSDSRIVDKAEVADGIVSPKKLFIYAGAFIVALLGGLAIAAIKEGLNSKVIFRSDIQESTDCPVLGDLVKIKGRNKNKIVTGEDADNTLIAEQFRKLWVSLGYLDGGRAIKRLMITSSVSGEGKTFTAANLALSLATAGKKVVIIDVDLRNPSLSQMYGLKSGKAGLADFLKGNRIVQEILQVGVQHENLDVIPAGAVTSKPSKLFSEGKFELLLDYLDNIYDYIILDTPPAGIVSDAYILSPYCNACLFVVRQNYTPKAALRRIGQANRLSQLNNTGIVFNGVPAREFNHYQHRYYTKLKKVKA